MAYSLPNWYKEKRLEFEGHFSSICDERHRIAKKGSVSTSPSGRFGLEIAVYSTGTDASIPSWEYSRGLVRRTSDGVVLADIKRNFGHFPFAWAKQEEREYLICGEDYQGYAVIDPAEGRTNVYVPDEAIKGSGFCWAEIQPSPNGRCLLVDGCYWAADYELRLYDFSTPLDLPLQKLASLSYLFGDPYRDSIQLNGRWTDDTHVELTAEVVKDGSKASEKSTRIWPLQEILGRVSRA